ncbi:MAG: hypothetical protein ABUL69_00610, partial [Peristeroidobacter soli]
YYAEGPPDSPEANIENLLKRDPRIAERMDAIMPVARAQRLGFRMAEGNSCYRGGKAGMSNALAGALWGMDYMLDMAARGCIGINFHGGGGSVISSALGDKLPGARDERDLKIARLGTFYSPIAGNPAEGYTARPLYEAMRAVEALAGTQLIGTEFDAAGANATAYAARATNGWRVALINKDANRDLTVDVTLPGKIPRKCVMTRLTGPSLDAIDDIRLVSRPFRVTRGGVTADLPRASAVVFSFSSV